MKLLVTGGAGAIGYNVCKEILSRGHEVIVIDDFSSSSRDNLLPGASYVDHSLGVGGRPLSEVLEQFEPISGVIHLAAFFANQNSVEFPHLDLRTNGHGIIEVLEYVSCSKVDFFLYSSSSCVYGSNLRANEDSKNFHFDTPYALTKYLGELYTELFLKNTNSRYVVTRLFNCYGPGELPGKYRNVIPNFINSALLGNPLSITGTGQESRDFLFAEDAARIILDLALNPSVSGVYNVGSSQSTSIIDLARLILLHTDSTSKIDFLERRPWDSISHRSCDNSKLMGIFPGIEFTTIEDGLIKTVEWLKSRIRR